VPDEPRSPIVACRGLRRTYGSLAAVDDLELDVMRGELLAVLGPSGCGKTTLLRLVAGFERPDGGTIAIEGVTVAGPGTFVPPERRRVGIVVQDHALFPHLTVAANVAYGIRRRPDRDRRVADVLAMVGLDAYGERYPAELSGGQQQRVAIARALAPEPGVILLDEPFANLDAALRARIRFEVRAILKAAGATAVLVTHDQEEALSLADRVAVVDRGRVVQVGPPDEVYRRPATPFVARFVGDADLVPGTSDGGRVATPLGELAVDGAVPAAGPALAVVRPEAIRLTAVEGGGAAGNGDRSGEATVATVTYYGHDQLVELALDGGTVIRARMGAERLFHAGERVRAEVAGPVIAYPGAGVAG
jgi:iron(III) transport system ATP-binding protein